MDFQNYTITKTALLTKQALPCPSVWEATCNERKIGLWGKWQEVVIKAQQMGEKACLLDLPRQRPLYIDRNRVKRVVCEQRDRFESLKLLSVGISTTPYIRSLPLPTTSVSLDCSISGESKKRTKLSEALSCNPRHFFLWKSLLSLSGGCHLSFNDFVLLCSRNSINILMQSRWGVILLLVCICYSNGVVFFSQDHDKAQSSL